MTKKQNAAENQHYVPKHILRNFLSNNDKEQVTVFDKKTQKTFTPNIAGIMGERRFNEFVIEEEWLASFEPAVSRIEDQVLPVYRDIVENRRLTGTPEERGLLAFLIAFQMVRTKAQRNTFLQMDQMLRDKWDKLGIERHDIGQLDQNPDELKIRHAEFMEHSLKEFTQIIGGKQFLLMEAAKGRSFYLGDNPVVLHNETKPDPFWGNIGLAVRGIEIYLPLSHDLLLAAWCPSIIEGHRSDVDAVFNQVRAVFVQRVMSGQMTASQMKEQLDLLKSTGSRLIDLIEKHDSGLPVVCDDKHVNFQNSLQMAYSVRHVICRQGDFGIARRFMKDHPNHEARMIHG